MGRPKILGMKPMPTTEQQGSAAARLSPTDPPGVNSRSIVAAARLDVLGVALQEVARALAPAQAAQVADAIRVRVADLTAAPITQTAYEALSGELMRLLAALGSPAQVTAAATRLC